MNAFPAFRTQLRLTGTHLLIPHGRGDVGSSRDAGGGHGIAVRSDRKE